MPKIPKVGCAVRQNVHFHDVSGRENRHFDAQNLKKRNKRKFYFLFVFFCFWSKKNKFFLFSFVFNKINIFFLFSFIKFCALKCLFSRPDTSRKWTFWRTAYPTFGIFWNFAKQKKIKEKIFYLFLNFLPFWGGDKNCLRDYAWFRIWAFW